MVDPAIDVSINTVAVGLVQRRKGITISLFCGMYQALFVDEIQSLRAQIISTEKPLADAGIGLILIRSNIAGHALGMGYAALVGSFDATPRVNGRAAELQRHRLDGSAVVGQRGE